MQIQMTNFTPKSGRVSPNAECDVSNNRTKLIKAELPPIYCKWSIDWHYRILYYRTEDCGDVHSMDVSNHLQIIARHRM